MAVGAGGDDVYASLLLTDTYLPGALVLAHSLRDAGTAKKLAILVTLDSVSAEVITQLKAMYDYVIPVSRVRNDRSNNLSLMNRPDLHSAFTKISLWRQTQFRKIVYIDADVVAYRAPDELFDLPYAFAAAPDIGWPDIFNTGVMVLTPNQGDYYALTALAERGVSFDGADQGLLNMYFQNNHHRLSFNYNVTPSAHYQYTPAYMHFQSSINMVHFIGNDKPWLQGRKSMTGNAPYDEIVGRWWAVYDRHYRKETPANTASDSQLTSSTAPPEIVQYYVKGEWEPRVSFVVPVGEFSGQQSEQVSGHTDSAPPPHQQEHRPGPASPIVAWDAQWQPPPAGSKPEAANFPKTHYEMSSDMTPFVPPQRYPSPPKNMWYEVPKQAPAPPTSQPKAIFPWEEHRSAPTRVFADLPALYPSPSKQQIEPPTPTTPTIKISQAWNNFTRTNAWDDVPEIEKYVDGLQQKSRRTKNRGLKLGGLPQSAFAPDEDDDADVPWRFRGLRVTDFPVDRPSLPVTPAPLRRSKFWGGGGGGGSPGLGGLGGEDEEEKRLPAAAGVPAQSDWDPLAQLQKLARQHMLSWALKRNAGGAPDGPEADDTQVDHTDTPAPVFAVRALRTALFGTPAPRESEAKHEKELVANKNKPVIQRTDSGKSVDLRSPSRPQGILLTPGTGTSRRKRVSFGHDVKAGGNVRIGDDSALPDELPGKFPASPFVAGKSETTSKAKSQQPRPRTRLAEALERARQNKSKGVAAASAADSRCQDAKTKPARQDSLQEKKPDEDQWEEIEDDNDDVDPDADRDMNVTVDLNEPQSRSGKYWKSQFEDYHAEAKAEMGKLVRYKALAKSYAQQKDSEALGLHARLREEQEKVRRMERQLAASGRQVTAKAKREGGHYDAELVEDLARQTSLAREYKEQVKDLELLLQDMEHEDDQEQDAEGRAGTRQHRVTSPRTHTTLLEAQRELRRARIQVKELERLKEERDRLKSELRFAEQRASKLAEENKKLAADLAQSGSKVSGLEKEASALKTQARQRDRELRKLKEDHEKLKENAKARYLEAEQVVHKKNDKISSLKDELQSLKSAGLASRVSARAKELERKLRSRGETLEPRDKEDALTLMEEAEEESTLLRGELDKLRQLSVKKGLIAPPRQAGVVRASRRESPEEQVAVLKALSRGAAKAPASSGMPREKAESEASNRASADLERRLERAKGKFRTKQTHADKGTPMPERLITAPGSSPLSSSNHFLLLLSDSALPLGSFALSSGLESYLAHNPTGPGGAGGGSIAAFLPISVAAYASANLPFALAAHRDPSAAALFDLADALDAATICAVGRRASVAQGHALLSVWERSFAPALPSPRDGVDGDALRAFSALLRRASSSPSPSPPEISAHLAPLFGAVASRLGLSARQAAYVFVLAHVKAVVSAAVRVRAGMIGPFQAQKVLASATVQDLVAAVIDREWETRPDEAGQTVPAMDLWIGRHEILYSRIFNS
ncbi:hypothetical protein P8C59_005231 [Phyllachora maydis]|uniref:glycogenin glucosyltransferase n=1 Tax=Phyllachora maydis TaxID=1825666 RepID=A0AAD9I593_9PEZI|nr:hypothetical protein P8C59_005231 [Phyllachora maydis]